jgi:hypothetical protein
MYTDMEKLILDQIREMRSEMVAEMTMVRRDMRDAMIEIGTLKAKVAMIGSIAGIAAAAVMQLASRVFFS